MSELTSFSPDGLLPAYGDEDSVEDVLAKRKKTGGRLKGTPNKQKKFELGATARHYGLRALATIVEILDDEDAPPTVRLQAANDILDRGFGKAKQIQEITGTDGGEIQSRLIIEFVGQMPTSQQSHSIPLPNHSTTVDTDPPALGSELINSPFRQAQTAKFRTQPSDVSDAIARTVQVPVFKRPWE